MLKTEIDIVDFALLESDQTTKHAKLMVFLPTCN